MALSTPAPRLVPSRHLEALVAEVEQLADRLATAPVVAQRERGGRRLADTVAATLQLDGADPDELPDLPTARTLVGEGPGNGGGAGGHSGLPAPGTAVRRPDAPPGTWLDAFGAGDDTVDTGLRAAEVVGAAAGLASDDLASALTGRDADALLAALGELHARLTRGLVAPERAGAPRTIAQAVHDASVGRILYLTAEPDTIDDELGRLADWLVEHGPDTSPVVTTGVLHGELLRIHPYDAANGRLARTAARLGLRAAGFDPHGLAAVEVVLAEEPFGYHQAMADTIRRRDLTRWVERNTEALAESLRRAARSLGVLDVDVPERAAAFLEQRSSGAFTLADHLAAVDGDREVAAADLRALLDAGLVHRVLGSHGLRFTVARGDAQTAR